MHEAHHVLSLRPREVSVPAWSMTALAGTRTHKVCEDARRHGELAAAPRVDDRAGLVEDAVNFIWWSESEERVQRA